MAKPLKDRRQMALAALNGPAFVRWVEARTGAPPQAEDTQRFILGFLEDEGLQPTSSQMQELETMVHVSDQDKVEAFIRGTRFFEVLDKAAGAPRPSKPA
jgi:hypothetical protein